MSWLERVTEDELREVLSPDLCIVLDLLGAERMARLIDCCAGLDLYIQRLDSPSIRQLQRRMICRDFDGTNQLSLAVRYHVSVAEVKDAIRSWSPPAEAHHEETTRDSVAGKLSWMLRAPLDEALAALTPDMRRLVEAIGLEAVTLLMEHCGGSVMYIVRPDGATFRRLRRRLICRDFDGANHQELARRYGVSSRSVYRILKEEAA